MKITEHEMLVTLANMALRMDDLTGHDVIEAMRDLGYGYMVKEARGPQDMDTKPIRLGDVRRTIDEYENLVESYGDEAFKEGTIEEGVAWETHASAARRIRRAIFEKVGETDPRAKLDDANTEAFLEDFRKFMEES